MEYSRVKWRRSAYPKIISYIMMVVLITIKGTAYVALNCQLPLVKFLYEMFPSCNLTDMVMIVTDSIL